MKPYGQQLRELRDAAGIRQDHLAARIGMSKPDLSESETGKRDMSYAEYLRAKAALVDMVEERTAAWNAALEVAA